MHWAQIRYPGNAAVVGAEIDLSGCLDLLDPRWCRVLSAAYDGFLAQLARAGMPLPRQTSGAHRLDRAVINYAVAQLQSSGTTIHSVRSCFAEGQPIFPDSAIFDQTHIQICVRDQLACITKKWLDP